jgi:hypothetical protein
MPFLSNPLADAQFSYRNTRNWRLLATLAAVAFAASTPTAHAINLTNTGNVTYSNPNMWTNPSTLTNNGGTATLTADSGSATSTPLSITVNGGAVVLATTQHLNAATINGGKMQVTSGTLKTNTLTLASSAGNFTGALDLTMDPLVVEPTASAKATVLGNLENEVAYGTTHTTGILSSTLATNMTLAIVDNANFGQTTFRGVAVDSNSLLVVPAILGDANLDGTVDMNDLTIVLNHLGSTTTAFTAGNFDGAATVDLTDLNDVLNNLGASIPSGNLFLSVQARPSPSVAGVPEPGSLLILASFSALLLRRRKFTSAVTSD